MWCYSHILLPTNKIFKTKIIICLCFPVIPQIPMMTFILNNWECDKSVAFSRKTIVLYLINICPHNFLDFGNLGFHFCEFANLFLMFNTILHMLLQLWSKPYTTETYILMQFKAEKYICFMQHGKHKYPNSLFKLLGAAVAALPPPYLLVKSSLMSSRKAIAIWRPMDSTATTQ